jgi:hypothetical protein
MLLLIWSAWGISYVAYLWISFCVIGFKKLPGCEFTALSHLLLKKNNHICVDSVLNSRLDKMQQQNGISSELLKTESNLPGPIQYVGSIICYQSHLWSDWRQSIIQLAFSKELKGTKHAYSKVLLHGI